MSGCCPCDDDRVPGLEAIEPGLPSLPRQIRSFNEARQALLAAISVPQELADWRAREGDDFGILWLEMWAYVSDILNFYDERIANESYLRTAVRDISLRRLVELLGHTPNPGVAGTTTIAAILEGRQPVPLPRGLGVRSTAFGSEKPQVFENDTDAVGSAFLNQWVIGPFAVKRAVAQDSPAPAVSLKDKKKFLIFGIPLPSSTSGESKNTFLFETAGLGLARDRLLLLDGKNDLVRLKFARTVTRVKDVRTIQAKDGRTYAEVLIDPPVTVPVDVEVSDIRASTPTVAAVVTRNIVVIDEVVQPNIVADGFDTAVYLDAVYRQIGLNAPIVVTDRADYLRAGTVTRAGEFGVHVASPDGPQVPTTRVSIRGVQTADLQARESELTFHFSFVDAGTLTRVRDTEIPADAMSDPGGVPIEGIVETPPEAKFGADIQTDAELAGAAGVLQQRFLIQDADQVGALVDGRIVFRSDGTATFTVMDASKLPAAPLKTPITIYGNILDVSRGETVFNEVLGSGDARLPLQQFKLKKKPLTYLHKASASGDQQSASTLEVRVNGVLWSEVKSFFGAGARDEVYIVRHDDQQNTTITFGDGVHGARLPSGVGNIAAKYRFGAGKAAPPAAAIRQLARSVKGLRTVVSPIAALEGKDPDNTASLRTSAPQTALLLKRAVSAADYEAIARQAPGVTQASARFLWIPSQMQAGVAVHYIGKIAEAELSDTLRLHGEPTVALEVTKAVPIAVSLDLGVEVDPRFVKDEVATAVKDRLLDEENGVLSQRKASIGGSFFTSRVYDAVLDVPGVISATGATYRSAGITIGSSGAVCVPTGHFLDFAAPEAVTVVGVDPIGSTPSIRDPRSANA